MKCLMAVLFGVSVGLFCLCCLLMKQVKHPLSHVVPLFYFDYLSLPVSLCEETVRFMHWHETQKTCLRVFYFSFTDNTSSIVICCFTHNCTAEFIVADNEKMQNTNKEKKEKKKENNMQHSFVLRPRVKGKTNNFFFKTNVWSAFYNKMWSFTC